METKDSCYEKYRKQSYKCRDIGENQQRGDCYKNNTDELSRCLSSIYNEDMDKSLQMCKNEYGNELSQCKTANCFQKISEKIVNCARGGYIDRDGYSTPKYVHW